MRALAATATSLGEVTGGIHAAGVSASQASIEQILRVEHVAAGGLGEQGVAGQPPGFRASSASADSRPGKRIWGLRFRLHGPSSAKGMTAMPSRRR